jgi:hypothetical protein
LIRVGVRDKEEGYPVGKLVGGIGLGVVRIDRRPSLSVEGEDYFIEVEGQEGEWRRRVEEAAMHVGGVILGAWI